MKQFKQYINEASLGDMIADTIERDCKPFIKDWQKLRTMKWLMSGRDVSVSDIMKQSVRKNRVPLSTPEEIHQMLDSWFKNKFGVKSRSNAVFCSFNPNLVDNYGTLYLIFPIGKYKVVSSPAIIDIYEDIQEIAYSISDIGYLHAKEWDDFIKGHKEALFKQITQLLNKSNYTDKLIFHNNEIMLTCKDYYIVNAKYNGMLLDHFRR